MFFLLIILLLPSTWARVLIYAKGFAADAYGEAGTLYLDVQDAHALKTFLERAGFDVDIIESPTEATSADVIIVLGCAKISDTDAALLLTLAKEGAGLIVDLRCPSPFTHLLRVAPVDDYVGIRTGVLSTEYATVTGYYVEAGEHTSCNAPACFGYESMYYVGKTLYAEGEEWRDVFTDASILVYRNIGQGRVAVTGCLLCASPLLLENLVDWAEDGVIDFPKVTVKREATLHPDGFVHDIFTIVAPIDVNAHIYYSSPSNCPLIKTRDETNRPRPLTGGRASVFFIGILQPLSSVCRTEDALIEFSWDGQRRHIIVRGESVATTIKNIETEMPAIPSVPMPRSLDELLLGIAGVLFVIFVILLLVQLKAERTSRKTQKMEKKDKRRLLRAQIRALRLKEREIEETLKELTRQWMTGKMDEDEYRKTKTLYEAKLANIRARIRMLRSMLSSKDEEERK